MTTPYLMTTPFESVLATLDASREHRALLQAALTDGWRPNLWCEALAQVFLATTTLPKCTLAILDHIARLRRDHAAVLATVLEFTVDGTRTDVRKKQESFLARMFAKKSDSIKSFVTIQSSDGVMTYGDFLLSFILAVPDSAILSNEIVWIESVSHLLVRGLPLRGVTGSAVTVALKRFICRSMGTDRLARLFSESARDILLRLSTSEHPSPWMSDVIAELSNTLTSALLDDPVTASEENKAVEALELSLCLIVNSFRSLHSFISIVASQLVPAICRTATCPLSRVHLLALNVVTKMIVNLQIALDRNGGQATTQLLFVVGNVVDSQNATTNHRLAAISVLHEIFSEPQHLLNVFLNHDCDLSSASATSLTSLISKISRIARESTDNSLRIAASECLCTVPASICMWIDRFRAPDMESPNLQSPSLTSNELLPLTCDAPISQERSDFNVADAVESKRRTAAAVSAFNNGDITKCNDSLSKVSAFMVIADEPRRLSTFMYLHNAELDKVMIGQLLAKPQRVELLRQFTFCHDFNGLQPDEALRLFLGGFLMAGEAQVVDRSMEIFAQRYCEQNPALFSSAGTVMVLAFSICMLNTDLHSPHITNRMSLERFIVNNRGIDDDNDIPPAMLENIYRRVSHDEFRLRGNTKITQPPTATSFISTIPVLRRVVPVLTSIVVPVLTAPIDVAINVTGIAQERSRREQQERFVKEMGGMMSQLEDYTATSKPPSHEDACPEARRVFGGRDVSQLGAMLHTVACELSATFSSCLSTTTDDRIFDIALRGATSLVNCCCDLGLSADVVALIRSALPSSDVSSTFAYLREGDGQIIDGSTMLSDRQAQLLSWHLDGLLKHGETFTDADVWRGAVFYHWLLGLSGYFKDEGSKTRQLARGNASFLGIFSRSNGVSPIGTVRATNRSTLTRFAVDAKLEQLFDISPQREIRPYMVEGLCAVALKHVQRFHRYELLATVTAFVTHAAMNSRLSFSRVWLHAGKLFTFACKQCDVECIQIAIASVTQIAFALLLQPELSQYHLQRDAFLPLQVAALENPPSREYVIAAIHDIVDTRTAQLSSAWTVVLNVLSHAAHFERSDIANQELEDLVVQSWNLLRRIMSQHAQVASLDATDRMASILRAVINFSCVEDGDLSLKALATVPWCARMICESNTAFFDGDDRHQGTWKASPQLSSERCSLLEDLMSGLVGVATHPIVGVIPRMEATRLIFLLSTALQTTLPDLLPRMLPPLASKLASKVRSGTSGETSANAALQCIQTALSAMLGHLLLQPTGPRCDAASVFSVTTTTMLESSKWNSNLVEAVLSTAHEAWLLAWTVLPPTRRMTAVIGPQQDFLWALRIIRSLLSDGSADLASNAWKPHNEVTNASLDAFAAAALDTTLKILEHHFGSRQAEPSPQASSPASPTRSPVPSGSTGGLSRQIVSRSLLILTGCCALVGNAETSTGSCDDDSKRRRMIGIVECSSVLTAGDIVGISDATFNSISSFLLAIGLAPSTDRFRVICDTLGTQLVMMRSRKADATTTSIISFVLEFGAKKAFLEMDIASKSQLSSLLIAIVRVLPLVAESQLQTAPCSSTAQPPLKRASDSVADVLELLLSANS